MSSTTQSIASRIADQITRFAGSMLFVDAERIRQTIVPEDLALPATWWSDFNSRVSEAIARATAMPAPAVAAWT